MNTRNGISRREMLRLLGIGTGAAVLSACQTGAPATTAPEVEPTGMMYDGITVRMLTQAGAAYDPAFNVFAGEFEEETGATINIEWAPWESLMPKVQADLASGTPQFDIFCNDVEFQYTIWPSLLPINDLITDTGYPIDGFFPFVYRYGEGIAGQEGVRYGLPMVVGVLVLFHRTDLIEDVPDTWTGYDEVLAANTTDDMYGLSFAGVAAQLVKLFLARYWSQGDPLLTTDWTPLINGEKGVKAVEMLYNDMKNYAPPGILAWDNPDASNAFLNGDVAVMEGWGGFILGSIDDPDASQVVDKWAIDRYPEGGTGNVVQHNMVIFNASRNPEAAFAFMAYCTNPDQQKRGAIDFGMDISRSSLYTDADVVAAKAYMPDYAKALEAGKPFTPGVPQWLEMFIGLAEGLSAALSEQRSAQDAMNDVAGKWVNLIEQNPLEFEYRE